MSISDRSKILEKHFAKSTIGGTKSINDIREKEFNGESLSEEEMLALSIFDKYRIQVLDEQETEEDYHNKYMELQVMANLSPYKEFFQEKYRKKIDL